VPPRAAHTGGEQRLPGSSNGHGPPGGAVAVSHAVTGGAVDAIVASASAGARDADVAGRTPRAQHGVTRSTTVRVVDNVSGSVATAAGPSPRSALGTVLGWLPPYHRTIAVQGRGGLAQHIRTGCAWRHCHRGKWQTHAQHTQTHTDAAAHALHATAKLAPPTQGRASDHLPGQQPRAPPPRQSPRRGASRRLTTEQ